MPVAYVFILLATGVVSGFFSGLIGIGGGIIMTPVQYWLYTSAGIAPELAIKMSFATSVAVILPTALSGVWRHHRLGVINWKAAIFMGVFTAIGAYVGATLAAILPGSVLKIAFGVITILVAIRMLTLKISDDSHPVKENLWLWSALAFPIGLLTGILGLGGGFAIIPILVLVLKFPIIKAVPTSLGIMLFTSIGAITGYIISGLNVPSLPDHTFGYIYWPGWIALSLTCITTAQLGAYAAHKLPGKYLKFVFAALSFYVGLNMLGVMEWLRNLIF